MEPVTDFDPRLNEAQKRLSQIIQHAVGGRAMTLATVSRVQSICNEFGMSCRLKGIDFPKLVVLPLVSIQQLVIWPAAASYMDVQVRIRQLVISLTRTGKTLNEEELNTAIRAVYPDYGVMMGSFIQSQIIKSAPEKLPIYANER